MGALNLSETTQGSFSTSRKRRSSSRRKKSYREELKYSPNAEIINIDSNEIDIERTYEKVADLDKVINIANAAEEENIEIPNNKKNKVLEENKDNEKVEILNNKDKVKGKKGTDIRKFIYSNYKGSNITVFIKGIPGTISGEVVFDIAGVVVLKVGSITVYINAEDIAAFY